MASVLWLPSKRIRRPAGIGTRVAHIRFRFNEYGAYATRAPNEVRPPLNPVPQRAKSVRRRLRNTGFQVEAAGEVVVWSEGGRKAVGRKARRFDRGLHVHAEHAYVAENLQHRLDLHVGSRRAEDEKGFALPKRDRTSDAWGKSVSVRVDMG